MKEKKSPRKFIKKAKVVEVVESPRLFTRFSAISFPKVRLIPEKELVVGFICGVLVVGIVFSAIRLIEQVKVYEKVLAEKKVLLAQKQYWTDVATTYPLYRDAHFRLGVLAYQEGNTTQAVTEVTKALELDPSFVEARLFLERVEANK